MKKMYIKTLEVAGFTPSLIGMRNPLDSWHLSDSAAFETSDNRSVLTKLGEKDLGLAQRLIKGGNEHAKFMRQIQVWANMNMPRYFWSEFDTYKFNVKNSCSTMHRLLNNDNPITLNMFIYCKEDIEIMTAIIYELESLRQEYKTKIPIQKEKPNYYYVPKDYCLKVFYSCVLLILTMLN